MDLKINYNDVQFKNDGRLKLLIIVGTRPEIIRLAAVINKCRKYFDCILAHTGQNYDYNLNGVFFKDLKLDNTHTLIDYIPNTESVFRKKIIIFVSERKLLTIYKRLYETILPKILPFGKGTVCGFLLSTV